MGDLAIAEVRHENKIQDQRERAEAADTPCQPRASGAEIKAHEYYERHDDCPNGKLRPTQDCTVLFDGLCAH